jgi:large subunit ribosomal protein L24
MHIKKGDTVKILSGADKGKTGKIIRSFPKLGRVVVEGVNLKKRHQRPRKAGEKGQIISFPAMIAASKAKKV